MKKLALLASYHGFCLYNFLLRPVYHGTITVPDHMPSVLTYICNTENVWCKYVIIHSIKTHALLCIAVNHAMIGFELVTHIGLQ